MCLLETVVSLWLPARRHGEVATATDLGRVRSAKTPVPRYRIVAPATVCVAFGHNCSKPNATPPTRDHARCPIPLDAIAKTDRHLRSKLENEPGNPRLGAELGDDRTRRWRWPSTPGWVGYGWIEIGSGRHRLSVCNSPKPIHIPVSGRTHRSRIHRRRYRRREVNPVQAGRDCSGVPEVQRLQSMDCGTNGGRRQPNQQ